MPPGEQQIPHSSLCSINGLAAMNLKKKCVPYNSISHIFNNSIMIQQMSAFLAYLDSSAHLADKLIPS
jgi:hypothetical protein